DTPADHGIQRHQLSLVQVRERRPPCLPVQVPQRDEVVHAAPLPSQLLPSQPRARNKSKARVHSPNPQNRYSTSSRPRHHPPTHCFDSSGPTAKNTPYVPIAAPVTIHRGW